MERASSTAGIPAATAAILAAATKTAAVPAAATKTAKIPAKR